MGDIHRGNQNCDLAFLYSTINTIKENPNAYWVSTGDLLEVATKNSKSDSYEASNLQYELDTLTTELSVISDKCLGFVASNHHNRVDKEIGISIDKVLAHNLNIPFLGITGLIRVQICTSPYFMCLHHGIGGGTYGGKVNNAMRIAHNYLGADIYMSGHTHTYSHVPFMQQVVDRKRGSIRTILSHSVVTGHCLKWKESYAEKLALHPAPIGFAYIDLFPNASNRSNSRLAKPGFHNNIAGV